VKIKLLICYRKGGIAFIIPLLSIFVIRRRILEIIYRRIGLITRYRLLYSF